MVAEELGVVSPNAVADGALDVLLQNDLDSTLALTQGMDSLYRNLQVVSAGLLAEVGQDPAMLLHLLLHLQ